MLQFRRYFFDLSRRLAVRPFVCDKHDGDVPSGLRVEAVDRLFERLPVFVDVMDFVYVFRFD